MKNQRILYVITKSNFGGAQRYVFELAVAMQAAGHRVAVASAPTGRLVDKLAAAQIEHFPIHSFQRDLSVQKEIAAWRELRDAMQQFAPDLIHLNSSKAGLLGAVVGRRLRHRPKIIFTAHGWPFLEPRAWWWKGLAWSGSYLTALLADTVIVVSDNDKKTAPATTANYQVIHTAVPPFTLKARTNARATLFSNSEQERHSSDLWLVTIAELHHNKNLRTAIEAVAQHNTTYEKKLFYTIIGDGEQKTELQHLITQRQMDTYITLKGYVDDARSYLLAFDAFLLPSKKEGFPYVLLEAGYAGLPIIASRVGGIPELITDRQSGLLIDPHDVDSITHALECMASNRNQAHDMATSLQTSIAHHCSLEHMVEKTTRVYSSMIDTSGAL